MGNRFSSSDSDSDRSRNMWDDLLSDSERSDRSSPRSRSPPPKRPRVELKYNDENSDDEETESTKVTYSEQGSTIKIKYCTWTIDGFSNCDVHKENGIIKSKVYAAGDYNEFQYYFIMEKLKAEDDTYFGVYVCVLSNIRSEATVKYKSYIIELRGHKYELASARTQKFPRKAGFRFLGSLCASRIMDDYWSYRMVPEDDLTLSFKINVLYRKMQSFNHLQKLFEDNKVKDITLVVKGKQFPANKKILSERSSVFAKMLEKTTKAKIQIDNVESEVMKQLLLYIYTGRVTKLFTYADKLAVAADKYKLKDLKAMCKKVKSS